MTTPSLAAALARGVLARSDTPALPAYSDLTEGEKAQVAAELARSSQAGTSSPERFYLYTLGPQRAAAIAAQAAAARETIAYDAALATARGHR